MIICSGGTYQVLRECREGRAKHSWVVGEVSQEEGISKAVGEVLENGKSREAWKSSVHLRICECFGWIGLCMHTDEVWDTESG